MALKSAIYLDCMWAEAALSAGYDHILCQAYSKSIGFLLEMYEKLLISRKHMSVFLCACNVLLIESCYTDECEMIQERSLVVV